MNFGYTFTNRCLRSSRRSLESIQRDLSRIPLITVLDFIHKISKRTFWERTHNYSYAENDILLPFLADYVPPVKHSIAYKTAQQEDFCGPTSNYGLLCFAALAYSCCADGDSIPGSTGLNHQLFAILVQLQSRPIPEDITTASNPIRYLPYLIRGMSIERRLQRNWNADLARLHALVSLPECEASLLKGFPTANRDSFFKDACGLTGREYQVAANIIFGAAFYGADFNRLEVEAPRLHAIVAPLLRHVISDLADTRLQIGQISSFDDLLEKSARLLSKPAVQIGSRIFVYSFDALFNRAIRDLPYVGFAARNGNLHSSNNASRYFGRLFEGYVRWLIEEWFGDQGAIIYSPYYDSNGCERDVAVQIGDIFIAFETKSGGASDLQLTSGDIAIVRGANKTVVKQVSTGAASLRAGTATDEHRRAIPAARLVIPCALTFENLPISDPFHPEFERRLEWDLGISAFRERNGILPVQFLDIQQLELCELLFDLPSDKKGLAELLAYRSKNGETRYRSLGELSEIRRSPIVMSKLSAESEATSSIFLADLNSRQPKLE